MLLKKVNFLNPDCLLVGHRSFRNIKRRQKITKEEIIKDAEIIKFKKINVFQKKIPNENEIFAEKITLLNLKDTPKYDDLKPEYLFYIFLSMIDIKKRVGCICSWQSIGKCICNIFKGNNEGLQLWLKITEIAEENEKYQLISYNCNYFKRSEMCERLYNQYKTINVNNLSYKTLAFFAKTDNPEIYKSWHLHWICVSLDDALILAQGFVSKLIFKILYLDY